MPTAPKVLTAGPLRPAARAELAAGLSNLGAFVDLSVHPEEALAAAIKRLWTEDVVDFAGEHYELDCIIYASGFEVGTGLARTAGFDAAGRGGKSLGTRTRTY